MSMHRIPLTELERAGLINYGLAVGKPSQLSDAFRHGVKWAIDNSVIKWISVSERLPENNSGLYLCSGHEGTKFVCYRRHREWIRSPQMKRVVAITHWMPIPSLPEAVK